ncbi:MAG: hypothetical protein R3B45_03545 [Bdellovibrionota bacterium]
MLYYSGQAFKSYIFDHVSSLLDSEPKDFNSTWQTDIASFDDLLSTPDINTEPTIKRYKVNYWSTIQTLKNKINIFYESWYKETKEAREVACGGAKKSSTFEDLPELALGYFLKKSPTIDPDYTRLKDYYCLDFDSDDAKQYGHARWGNSQRKRHLKELYLASLPIFGAGIAVSFATSAPAAIYIGKALGVAAATGIAVSNVSASLKKLSQLSLSHSLGTIKEPTYVQDYQGAVFSATIGSLIAFLGMPQAIEGLARVGKIWFVPFIGWSGSSKVIIPTTWALSAYADWVAHKNANLNPLTSGFFLASRAVDFFGGLMFARALDAPSTKAVLMQSIYGFSLSYSISKATTLATSYLKEEDLDYGFDTWRAKYFLLNDISRNIALRSINSSVGSVMKFLSSSVFKLCKNATNSSTCIAGVHIVSGLIAGIIGVWDTVRSLNLAYGTVISTVKGDESLIDTYTPKLRASFSKHFENTANILKGNLISIKDKISEDKVIKRLTSSIAVYTDIINGQLNSKNEDLNKTQEKNALRFFKETQLLRLKVAKSPNSSKYSQYFTYALGEHLSPELFSLSKNLQPSENINEQKIEEIKTTSYCNALSLILPLKTQNNNCTGKQDTAVK